MVTQGATSSQAVPQVEQYHQDAQVMSHTGWAGKMETDVLVQTALSCDALSHRQYKGAQVTLISRLRKREGIQEAVSVLVLSSQRWYCQHTGATQKCRLFTSGALFFVKRVW